MAGFFYLQHKNLNNMKNGKYLGFSLFSLVNLGLAVKYFLFQEFMLTMPFLLLFALAVLSMYFTYLNFNLGSLIFGIWTVLVPIAVLTQQFPREALIFQIVLPLVLIWMYGIRMGFGINLTWLTSLSIWLVNSSMLIEFWPQLLAQVLLLVLLLLFMLSKEMRTNRLHSSEQESSSLTKKDSETELELTETKSILAQDKLWDALVSRELKMLELKKKVDQLESELGYPIGK